MTPRQATAERKAIEREDAQIRGRPNCKLVCDMTPAEREQFRNLGKVQRYIAPCNKPWPPTK